MNNIPMFESCSYMDRLMGSIEKWMDQPHSMNEHILRTEMHQLENTIERLETCLAAPSAER